MRDIILNEVLIPSLRVLYEMDHDNIRFGVSERNICARLAHHMECLMRKYDDHHPDSPYVGKPKEADGEWLSLHRYFPRFENQTIAKKPFGEAITLNTFLQKNAQEDYKTCACKVRM